MNTIQNLNNILEPKKPSISKERCHRHAISRAELFLELASKCTIIERNNYEAFLESSIIFARASLHHLQYEFSKNKNWDAWWNEIKDNEAAVFFKDNRDTALKESAIRLRQHVNFSQNTNIENLYSIRNGETAAKTIRIHLDALKKLIGNAEDKFNQ